MTIGRRIGYGFATSLAIMLAFGALAFRTTGQLIETNRTVTHTYEVLIKLEVLLSLLKDAETGQRGFLLTTDEKYLDPFDGAEGRIDPTIKALTELTSDNPNQQRRLEELGPKVTTKMAELRKTIELHRGPNGSEAALALVRTNQGKTVMEDIRRVVAEMDREERDLLRQRNADAESGSRFTQYMIGIGAPWPRC